nr:coatomer subunit delta [Ipomoea trifida]
MSPLPTAAAVETGHPLLDSAAVETLPASAAVETLPASAAIDTLPVASLVVVSTTVTESSGHTVGVDCLPDEMNGMKIRDDKDMEASVVDGKYWWSKWLTKTGKFVSLFCKGISSSALPHKRTPLSWLSISSQDGVSLVLSLVEGTLKKLEFTVIHLGLDVIAAYCNYFKFSIAFDLNKGSESVGKVNLRYDSRNSILEWSIVLIDASNRSGSLEFVVPAADPSSFFPISARLSSSKTFSDLKDHGGGSNDTLRIAGEWLPTPHRRKKHTVKAWQQLSSRDDGRR